MTLNNDSAIKIIGLTGSTGSGKSSVAAIMAKYGCFIINADVLAHKTLLQEHTAYYEIVKCFGPEILEQDSVCDNKPINRKKLGSIVFSDHEKKSKLEEITHKYVIKEIEELIHKIKSNPGAYKFIVIDAPLLIESGLDKKTDIIWITYAPKELRKSRIIKRDSITDIQAEQRMSSQTEFSYLCKFADEIIENTENLDVLEQKVKHLLRCVTLDFSK